MLLNAAKCQGYRFYHFRVIKGENNETTGGVKLLSSTQIRVLGNTDNPHALFNEVKSTRSCKDMSVNFVSLLEIYCKA